MSSHSLSNSILTYMIAKLKRAYNKLKDYKYFQISYAQEGEDLLLTRIFESAQAGFYVDVGAYHPKRFSNTFLFYKKGWRGINIDARPGSMLYFNKERPRDINLEIGVSKYAQELTYYMYSEPAYNGFIESFSDDNIAGTEFKKTGERQVKTLPLQAILNQNLPENQVISFLSVDVEGLDLQVLESNNWEKYRPKIVLVEMLDVSADFIPTTELHEYLTSKGYFFFCKTLNTVFYKDKILY